MHVVLRKHFFKKNLEYVYYILVLKKESITIAIVKVTYCELPISKQDHWMTYDVFIVQDTLISVNTACLFFQWSFYETLQFRLKVIKQTSHICTQNSYQT